MNIRDLKYLVAIADYSHFGKAAAACFISQPALSMQIKKLEDNLGVQLIERTNKSVLLTEIGKLIIEQAREILHRVDSLKDTAKQARDPFSGELHLGIIPTLAPYLLPHIISTISKLFPKLTIYLIEEQTHQLTEKLRQGKLDGALFGLPLSDTDFTSLPLFEEELILALSINHELAKKKTIHPKDLSNEEILLLEDGHCLRDQVLALCARMNVTANKSFQATSLETLRHMVAFNAGITLLPKLACRTNDGLCYLPLDLPTPARKIGMIWRPSSAKKIIITKIAEQIRKSLAKSKLVNVIS